MKLLDIAESTIGVAVGLVLIGMSGMFFALPEFGSAAWGGLFAVSLVFTIWDFKNNLDNLSGHPFMLIGLFLNNAIDFVIEAAMTGMMFGFSVPFISSALEPYLGDPTILLYAGVFFIVTSLFWLIDLSKV